MKIEKLNIAEITEYENNAKLHPREQIEQIKNQSRNLGIMTRSRLMRIM